jgi:transposase
MEGEDGGRRLRLVPNDGRSEMQVAVGIDVAKEFHWATAIDDRGGELLSRRVDDEPAAIQALSDELERLRSEPGAVTVGIDVVGGIASLLTATLAEAGLRLVHVPGLAVNRARQGTSGGEHKSDPRDAKVIAEQVRTRSDLRPIESADPVDVELRLLVGRRRELVTDQTRRIGQLRDLLASIHPGLERVVDPTQKTSLLLLRRYVTPGEIRRAGTSRLVNHLLRGGRLPHPHVEQLAEQALTAARAQRLASPESGSPPSSSASSPKRRSRFARGCSDSTATSSRRSPATLTQPSSAACQGWGRR